MTTLDVMSTPAPSASKVSAVVGLSLGSLVAAWILWTYRGDSDYDQVFGWAVVLGVMAALPFLVCSIIAWFIGKVRFRVNFPWRVIVTENHVCLVRKKREAPTKYLLLPDTLMGCREK